jgi:hypothetical protein
MTSTATSTHALSAGTGTRRARTSTAELSVQVATSPRRARTSTALTSTLAPPPLGGVRVPVVQPSAWVSGKAARLVATGSVTILEVGPRRVLARR